MPLNANVSCSSSDTDGVLFVGDTCNFTCNTGYELTGSDTRTCQSDGSWSGTDVSCKRGKIYNITFHTYMAIAIYSRAKQFIS